MNIPLQISYRDVDSSESIEAAIRKEAAGLEKYFDKITSCRVMVEVPHRRHLKGRHFHIRVDLTIPGHEFVVNRDPAKKESHEDIYVAIRDSFRAVRRELKNYVARRREQEKLDASVL